MFCLIKTDNFNTLFKYIVCNVTQETVNFQLHFGCVVIESFSAVFMPL